MKVFLVERQDKVDYDETESMVVIAVDSTQALEVASKGYWGDYKFNSKDMDVTEQSLSSEPRIILSSFKAG